MDLGVGGISYVELLILCELWAGERLTLEKAPSSVCSTRASNFCVGCSVCVPGIDIWRSCCFIGAMMRSLRVAWWSVPCSIVLILAGFCMLVGRGVVMGLLLGLGKVLLVLFWISSCCNFNILLGFLVRCLLNTSSSVLFY